MSKKIPDAQSIVWILWDIPFVWHHLTMGSFESPPDLLGKWWLQWLMMGMTRGIGFECMDPGMVWQMVVLVTGVPCLSCALVLSMVKCGTVEDAQPGGGHGQGCERCARPTWTPPVPSIRPLIHQPLIGIIFPAHENCGSWNNINTNRMDSL